MIVAALDALLPLVVAEALALALFHTRTGRGIPPLELWPNLAAGFLLMAAVRLAIGGEAPTIGTQTGLAAMLAFAGMAHALDLKARWRR